MLVFPFNTKTIHLYVMDVSLCISCNKEVRRRQHSLQCYGCERWQHRLCKTGIYLFILNIVINILFVHFFRLFYKLMLFLSFFLSFFPSVFLSFFLRKNVLPSVCLTVCLSDSLFFSKARLSDKFNLNSHAVKTVVLDDFFFFEKFGVLIWVYFLSFFSFSFLSFFFLSFFLSFLMLDS